MRTQTKTHQITLYKGLRLAVHSSMSSVLPTHLRTPLFYLAFILVLTSVNNTQDNAINDFIEHLEMPKLTDEERDSIEGQITFMECKTVLDTFLRGKMDSPLKFINFLLIFIILYCKRTWSRAFAAYDANELTISQRRGVVTFIPKKDGSLLEYRTGVQ